MLKSILLFLIVLCLSLGSSAQDIIIPDSAFFNFIIAEGYDLNADGAIQEIEGLAIENLIIKGADSENIESIEGVSFLKNLQRLTVENSQISDIDLRENLELNYLKLASTSTLKNVLLPKSKLDQIVLTRLSLDSIDLSEQELLTSLSLTEAGFSELDITDCINLSLLNIRRMDLLSLDLTQQRSVVQMSLDYAPMTSIDLSNMTLLVRLSVTNSNLTELDLSQQKDFQIINISDTNFKNLDNVFFHPEARLKEFIFGDTDRVGGVDQLDFSQDLFSRLKSINYKDYVNTEYSFVGLDSLERIFCVGPIEILDLNHLSLLTSVAISAPSETKQLLINNGSKEDLVFNSEIVLENICCDLGQVNDVAAYLSSTGINCTVSSYCGFNDFDNRSSISGKINIQQASGSCPYDKILNNRQKLTVSKDNISVVHITGPSGNYNLPLELGDYRISPRIQSPFYSASPNIYEFNVPDNNSLLEKDFDLIPVDDIRDLEVYLSPLGSSQPGFSTEYLAEIHNKGTTCVTSELTLFYQDLLTTFVSSDIPDVIQDGSELLWQVSNLGPYEKQFFKLTFEHNKPTDLDPLSGGEILNFVLLDDNRADDETPVNNVSTLKDEVVNSFDPNDIRCLEGNNISESKVGDHVHYLIRFENTGSANARNVIVQDSIDLEKFDFETLEIVNASHEVAGRLLPEGSAEFIFADIDLPFDGDNNDGYVLFRIKTLDNLEVGDNIASQANIYFDFNFPIVTNLYTTDIIGNSTTYNHELSEYSIYPNPSTDIVHVQSPFESISIKLYNLSGQLIVVDQVRNSTIDVSSCDSGTYFLEITDVLTNERHIEKLVIIK